MNFWKLGARAAFVVAAGLCVSSAYSAVTQALEWKSSGWLGSCKLKAENTSGAEWSWVASGYSNTVFKSVWPKTEGELFITNRPAAPGGEALIGAEIEPTETLTIRFGNVDGKVTPLWYIYDNVKARTISKGMVQPRNCPLQPANG